MLGCKIVAPLAPSGDGEGGDRVVAVGGVGGWTGRLRLEPNDNVRFAHNDGARAIAHNPRKRGDGALVISPTGRKQIKIHPRSGWFFTCGHSPMFLAMRKRTDADC